MPNQPSFGLDFIPRWFAPILGSIVGVLTAIKVGGKMEGGITASFLIVGAIIGFASGMLVLFVDESPDQANTGPRATVFQRCITGISVLLTFPATLSFWTGVIYHYAFGGSLIPMMMAVFCIAGLPFGIFGWISTFKSKTRTNRFAKISTVVSALTLVAFFSIYAAELTFNPQPDPLGPRRPGEVVGAPDVASE